MRIKSTPETQVQKITNMDIAGRQRVDISNSYIFDTPGHQFVKDQPRLEN